MNVITDWTKTEIRYIKADLQRITRFQKEATKGNTAFIKRQLRIQTAKLEKAVDSLDRKLSKPVLALEVIHKLAFAIQENLKFIQDNGLPIEKDYKIWAAIALRRYHKYVGDTSEFNKMSEILTYLLSD